MKDNDILNQKLASYVMEYDDGLTMQHACLVNTKTGIVDIGEAKFVGSHFNPKAKPVGSRLEFRGQEFELQQAKIGELNKPQLKHIDAFNQHAMKPFKEFVPEPKRGSNPKILKLLN